MKKFGLFLVVFLVLTVAVMGLAATAETIVYVTKTGTKYHIETCASLRSSKIAIKLGEAVKKYEPCKVCNPPVLDVAEE